MDSMKSSLVIIYQGNEKHLLTTVHTYPVSETVATLQRSTVSSYGSEICSEILPFGCLKNAQKTFLFKMLERLEITLC